MSQPLLVVDVSYLCHRAFHTSRGMEWKGRPTGVTFGFLKSITYFKDEFQTDRIAFCFDDFCQARRELYPPYKHHRHTKERTEEETKAAHELKLQISQLRLMHLPDIGFKNVFFVPGMESDDLMAAIAAAASPKEDVILLTSDADLYQCLRPNVSIYSPQKNKLLTDAWFEVTHGIPPRKWAVVKAIAGCHSDEVEGVGGVGEATALKYLRGELAETSAAYKTILSQRGRAIVRRNRQLVQLPFSGCPAPQIQDDHVSKKAWLEVCGRMGMKSLAARPPVATRKLTNV